MTLLKVLVPPLIVTAVIVSIANLKQVSNAARLAGQTLLWFAITALIAVVDRHRAGPAHPARRNSSSTPRRRPTPETTGSWWDFLTGLVPAQHPRPAGRADDDGRSCRSTCSS